MAESSWPSARVGGKSKRSSKKIPFMSTISPTFGSSSSEPANARTTFRNGSTGTDFGPRDEWHHASKRVIRMNGEQPLVERRDRGVIRHAASVYGTSLEGVPLTVYLPDAGSAEIIVLA